MSAPRGETIAGLEILPYQADDALIEATVEDRKPRHRIHRPPEVQVVLGRGSRPEKELNTTACREDGVPVFRRHGGGCAVVLDPGNLVVSVVLPVAGFGDNPRHFERITDWLTTGLERAGVPNVRQRGISDLALGERKIGGACIYRARDLLFYTTTLLVTPDTDLMNRYLAHPPREPDYRRNRTHSDFVTSLSRTVPAIDSPEQLRERLSSALDLDGLS
jgi:lipoate-protein ligase A